MSNLQEVPCRVACLDALVPDEANHLGVALDADHGLDVGLDRPQPWHELRRLDHHRLCLVTVFLCRGSDLV